MGLAHGVVFCLAYVVGLLSTGVWWGRWLVLIAGIGSAVIIPRYSRTAPRNRVWLAASVIALLASGYFQIRIPQPAPNDVSRLISATASEQKLAVAIQGKVESLPRLTRSQKAQFWLEVQGADGEIASNHAKSIGGRLYVTVPLLQATGIHPGQVIQVTGTPYLPQPATNPGAFDFKAYLAQEDCFAGLRGQQIKVLKQETGWGWWRVQQQIVRSQMRWLGSPAGPLVSAMVLGSRGVDLPYEVQDSFKQVGLAHALAASGFQTTLILGVVLALTRRFSERTQAILGSLALLIFIGLAGAQPAVLRAALMGFGSLGALMMQRKIKPLGTLLVVAIALLMFKPLWIWNLGFQLSFLATLGLLVTVPTLSKWLDWMPTAIAPFFAVPIAAYLWTLPQQLYAFGVVSPYSIPANLVTTLLISVLSLGGMASALLALIYPLAGSASAWLLYYPAQALIAIVDWFSQLPGNSYAVGTIPALTAIALYSLILFVWLIPWWRRRWWLALLLGLGLVIIPVWQARANLFRVTLLATNQPVMVVQEGGKTGLVNTGNESTANLTILPFLQKEGVNDLQWAVSTEPSAASSGWQTITDRLPIQLFYANPDSLKGTGSRSRLSQLGQPLPLPNQSAIQAGSVQFRQISVEPAIVEFQMANQKWLWLGAMSQDQQAALLKTQKLPQVQVLCWNGKFLHPELIAMLKPQVAIAVGKSIHASTKLQLKRLNSQIFWTNRDGAIQWTPQEGFRTTLSHSDREE